MIDLRSDTLTLPGREMLETILGAALGDDGRPDASGRGEDPTVNRLEDEAAALFGKEGAVFFPTGTLANHCALLTHARPGDTVLAEPLLHVVRSEEACFSPRFGQLRAVPYGISPEGKPFGDPLESLPAGQKAALLVLENTHNFRGGLCLSAEETDRLCAAAHRRGVPVHLDGARIFNAAAFTGQPVSRLCRSADSVMFCLSKGLGAPAGSLVAGGRDFVRELRRTRKLLGGTLRQAGVLAAPGLYALRRQAQSAARDNRAALLFARSLGTLACLRIPHPVQSNIVMIDTEQAGISPQRFCELAFGEGLYIRPVLETAARLVFHAGVGEAEVLRAAEIVAGIDRRLAAGAG